MSECKWDVADALKTVRMKAPAKAIMLALLTYADVKTAAIPPRHTPSLDDLAAVTGLGRSTVAQYLNHLEAAGWVVRERPSVADAINRGRRTCYRLAAGETDLGPKLKYVKHERGPRKAASSGPRSRSDRPGPGPSKPARTGQDSPGAGRSEEAHSPGDGPSMVQEPDDHGPGAGHFPYSSVHQGSSPPVGTPDGAPPPTETDETGPAEPDRSEWGAKRLCAEWIASCRRRPPKKVIGQIGRHAAELLDEGMTPDEVAAGLARWADKGDLHPSMLPEMVHEAVNAPVRRSAAARRVGSAGSWELELEAASRDVADDPREALAALRRARAEAAAASAPGYARLRRPWREDQPEVSRRGREACDAAIEARAAARAAAAKAAA